MNVVIWLSRLVVTVLAILLSANTLQVSTPALAEDSCWSCSAKDANCSVLRSCKRTCDKGGDFRACKRTCRADRTTCKAKCKAGSAEEKAACISTCNGAYAACRKDCDPVRTACHEQCTTLTETAACTTNCGTCLLLLKRLR